MMLVKCLQFALHHEEMKSAHVVNSDILRHFWFLIPDSFVPPIHKRHWSLMEPRRSMRAGSQFGAARRKLPYNATPAAD